ncbi:MAG: retropepsin-like aspartic protease [Gammaproteobacteria bacterium]|jgi:hypothetical protein
MKAAYRFILALVLVLASCSTVHPMTDANPNRFDRLQEIVQGNRRGRIPGLAIGDRATRFLSLGLRERTRWQFRQSDSDLRRCISLKADETPYAQVVRLLCLSGLAGNQYLQGHYHEWAIEIRRWMSTISRATARLSSDESTILREQMAEAFQRPVADFDGYMRTLKRMARIMEQLPTFSPPAPSHRQIIQLETYPETKYQFVAKGVRNGHKTKQKYRWTITLDPAFPAVRVDCAGTKFLMGLDTGSSLTTLSQETAKRLHVSSVPSPIRMAALRGGYTPAHIGTIPKLKIGESVFRNLPVAVLDRPPAIGDNIGLMTLLHLGAVTIDHAKRTMTILPESTETTNGDLPMRLASMLTGNDPRLVFVAHHAGVALNVQLDTGNSDTPVGHKPLLEALPDLREGMHIHREYGVSDQTSVSLNSTATVDTFDLTAGTWKIQFRHMKIYSNNSVPGNIAINTSERDFLRDGSVLSLNFRRGIMSIIAPRR